MRTAQTLGDPKIGHQESNRLGDHGASTIAMNREVALFNVLLFTGFGYQYLGKLSSLPIAVRTETMRATPIVPTAMTIQ